MSNPLSVRRVKVQTIDEYGNPEGEPTFGVMASDDFDQAYNDTFESLEDLNKEIEEQGSIIKVVSCFDEADPDKIGTKNFYGKDWETNIEEDEFDDEEEEE